MSTAYPTTAKVKALTGSRKKSFFLYPRTHVAPRGGWSGGSRSSFDAINYVTGAPVVLLEGDNFSAQTVSQELKPGCIMIETGTFCGKPATPAIYCRPDEVESVQTFLGVPFEHRAAVAV